MTAGAPPDRALMERVLAYVREHDWVSFAALHREFAGDAREETQIELPGNRVIGAGMPVPRTALPVAIFCRKLLG